MTSALQSWRFACGLPGPHSGGSFPGELPACPGTPQLLPLPNRFPPSPSRSLPGRPAQGQSQPRTLHPEPPGSSLPTLPPVKLRSGPAWKACLSSGSPPWAWFFRPSAILPRFLTFKPICQLLLFLLTGSCWHKGDRSTYLALQHVLGESGDGMGMQAGYLTRHH